jgi:hypothetical protein
MTGTFRDLHMGTPRYSVLARKSFTLSRALIGAPADRCSKRRDHAIDRQPGAMHPRASETPSYPG